VIMFAKDTVEDPAQRMERDGFLDEVERISEATGVFDGDHFEALDRFLARPGPEIVPEPERLDRYEHALAAATLGAGHHPDAVVEALAADVGVEMAYAHLRFARVAGTRPFREAADRLLGPRLPPPPAPELEPEVTPYLVPELAELPTVAQPKVEPRRLSTGQAPLEIMPVGDAWRIVCTGCGEASTIVRYRWQVLDQTVDCRCA
jgi:hypothetical protein